MRENEQLTAHAAITQVLARYARAIDRLDWALLRSCYHPEAVEDRGRYVGPIEGFVDWLKSTLGGFESTWHLVGIPLIELDGDVAWVETYCLGIQRGLPDADGRSSVRQIPCRYCDRFERRDGDWRIARRVAVYEQAITVAAAEQAAPMGELPRRNRGDAAYRRED